MSEAINKVKLTKQYNNGKNTHTIFSSINKDEFKMSINENAMSHIISRLTDLYSDPIIATVREIVSNAIDATNKIPLKDRKPIDINIPSTLSLEFSVTDHALGLTFDEIKNIYTQYGSSTKGTDLTQIGAYGLGSKAPLSYAPQFTVSTAKDGELTQILISVEGNENKVKIIKHEATDSDNFMSVMIPIKSQDVPEFRAAIKNYVDFPVKDIEFNGIEELNDSNKNLLYFDKFEYGGFSLTSYFSLDLDSNRRRSLSTFVSELLQDPDDVIGSLFGLVSGFPYSLIKAESNYYGTNRTVDFYVDLIPGLVDFSSSRDTITSNERSKELSESFLAFVKSELQTKVLDVCINKMNDSDKIRLFGLLPKDGEWFENKDLLARLFTLDNGKNIIDLIKTNRVMGIIYNNDDYYKKNDFIVDYGNDKRTVAISQAPIKRLINHFTGYFNTEAYNNYLKDKFESYSVDSDEEYEPVSDEAAKKDNSLSLIHLLSAVRTNTSNHKSNKSNPPIYVVTDVSNAREATKVLRGRKLVLPIDDYSKYSIVFISKEQSSSVKAIQDIFDSTRDVIVEKAEDLSSEITAVRAERRKNKTEDEEQDHSIITARDYHYTMGVSQLISIITEGYLSTNEDFFRDVNRDVNDEEKQKAINIAIIDGHDSGDRDFKNFWQYLTKIKDTDIVHIVKYDINDLRLKDFNQIYNNYDYIIKLTYNQAKSSQFNDKLDSVLLNPVKSIDVDLNNTNLSNSLCEKLIKIGLIINLLKVANNSNDYINTNNLTTIEHLLDLEPRELRDYSNYLFNYSNDKTFHITNLPKEYKGIIDICRNNKIDISQENSLWDFLIKKGFKTMMEEMNFNA